MNKLFYFVAVLGALFSTSVSSSSVSNRITSLEDVKEEDGTLPVNRQEFPDGYWFGTQNLFCVIGVTGSPSSSGRKRRGLTNVYSSRYPLRFAHRLMYFRGLLFEWGTGTLGYFMGTSPSVVDCPIIWEKQPTGNSTCSTEDVKQFTYDYRSRYGVYNLATNNCHHFANRISELLSSSNCSAHPSSWTHLSRRFWRYLGGLVSQHRNTPVRFNDIEIHHDRSTIH